MSLRSRSTWWTIAFLIVCLAAGWVLADVYAPRPIIGVAHFEGLIDPASAQQMTRIVEGAREDARMAAVVLEIDSFGGDARSSELLYHTLLSLRQQKPLIVAIAGAATSGGYHMAIAGNKIYAPAVAEIGNIGAISSRPWDPALSPDVLSTGPYKLSGGSRFDNIRQLELVRDSFLGNVVYQRSQSPYNPLKADPKTVAEAHVYLGSEALALGLVDAPGGTSDAISAAAELAGITSYRVVQLTDYLGLTFQPSTYFKANSLFKAALPGTVFLLDSRIPLSAPFAENAAIPGAQPAWTGRQPDQLGGLFSHVRTEGGR